MSAGQLHFRDLVQQALRQARRKDDGRRFTQQDLAAAIGIPARDFSERLNVSRGKGLPTAVLPQLVAALITQGAIGSITQAAELLELGGTALSDEQWQQPPFSLLEAAPPHSPRITAAPQGKRPLPLAIFRTRLRELYRRADPYADGRHPRQQDLAHAISLAPTELSRRLNGLGNTTLTTANVRAIVRVLAEWGAITSRAEAEELLTLLAAPSFSAGEWATPPLDLLDAVAATNANLPPTNLPRALTNFIGRRDALVAATRLLDTQPLLTITGPGGTGKTRFSLELAANLRPRFRDGVYFLELAAVLNPELVATAIAQVLPPCDVITTASREMQIIAQIGDKRLLLILDNCEQLTTTVAALVQLLLTRCPNLSIIATSREGLGLAAETLFPLRPLSLPHPDLELEELGKAEAVQLFVARARAVRYNFALDAQNAAHVAAVVSRLEGIPLAIELAAPLVQTLSTSQLAARLDEGLHWLVSSNPTLPLRQRSLRTSIEWSYDLLSPDEQRLFRRLAVFSGGWELSAAEAVCAEDVPADSWVLQAMARLVRSSLLHTEPTPDGEMRYNWLAVVGEFAAAQLAATGEAETIAHRHAHLYLTLAEQMEAGLIGSTQAQLFARIDYELDNFRAAMNWALQHNDSDLVQRIASALQHFWTARRYFSEGRKWLTHALAQVGGQPTSCAKALHVLNMLASDQTDLAKAQAQERCLLNC